MKEQKFIITGMMCAACQAHVENAVKKLNGIETVSVNLLSNTMDVSYNDSVINTKTIISAVKKAGYGAKVFSRDYSEYDENTDKTKTQLILSVAFLIPLMFVSMSPMFGLKIPIFENLSLLGAVEVILLIPIVIINRKNYKGNISLLIFI